jgi:hypothetical protein
MTRNVSRQTATVVGRDITLEQVDFALEDALSADPTLSGIIVKIDRNKIRRDITRALRTMATVDIIQGKAGIANRNRSISKIEKAAIGLLKLLTELERKIKVGEETSQDIVAEWVMARLSGPMIDASLQPGSTAPSLSDLVLGLEKLTIGAKARAKLFSARGSVNQMFVARYLSRIFEAHFGEKAKRLRREDVPDGAFVAFAQSIMNTIGVPVSLETISTMMSDRVRRKSVGQ